MISQYHMIKSFVLKIKCQNILIGGIFHLFQNISYFGTIIWGKKRKFKLFRHMIWTLLTIFVQYY